MKNNMIKLDSKQIALIVVMLLALLFPVVIRNAYYQRILIMAMIYIMLASSLNLLIGYLGLFSMGHAAFYCIGAYASGLLSTRLGVPFPVCMLAAGMLAAFAGFLIGFATLRLSDIFFTFATLGLSEVVRIIILNSIELTGGPLGIQGVPAPMLFGKPFAMPMYYYLGLILVVLALICIYNFIHSNTGRSLMSIREDEQAARSLGINTFKYKITTMIIACFIAGIAGSFYAHFTRFVNADAFNINESINMVSMVVIGGMGTCVGPVIGAITLVILPELFRFLSEYRQMIYSLALICTIVFAPKGICGIKFTKLFKRSR